MKIRFGDLFTFLLILFILGGCTTQRPFRPGHPVRVSPLSGAVSGNTIRHHDLTLHLDLSSGTVQVEDEMVISVTTAEVNFHLHKGMKIEEIAFQGKRIKHRVVETDKGETSRVTVLLPGESPGKIAHVVIRYRGSFPQIDFSDGRHRGTEVGGYINKDAALLLSNAHWYPDIPEQTSLMTYDLRVYAPAGQEVISAGERIPPGEVGSGKEYTLFRMRHPTDEINLVTGEFHVKKREVGEIALFTFFTEDDPELEEIYLSALQDHLGQYQKRFGPYPYKAMLVVATPLMEGLGFPGFTLIGERLLRIPNLPQTSLGHELLHNWFGNGVYVDIDQGNWSEGLVTYLVDYRFSVAQRGAAAARRSLLEDYSIYTRSGREPSLTEFRARESPEQMAVGYDKGAFIFEMLERRLGKDRFDQALRQLTRDRMFKKASWKDLQSAFEAAAGESLDPFFRQWVYGVGAPSLRIEDARLSPSAREVVLTLTSEPAFRYDVPIEIKTDRETIITIVSLKESSQTVTLKAPSAIETVTVDPEYTLLRKFLPEELPMTIASVLETEDDLSVLFSKALNEEERGRYEDFLKSYGIKYHQIERIAEGDGPTLIMGPPPETGSIGGWSPQEVPWKWGGTALTIGKVTVAGGKETAVFAWRGPKGVDQPVVWIVGYSLDGLQSLARRLGYFSASSYLLLREGKRPVRGEWRSNERPLHIAFREGRSGTGEGSRAD